MKPDSVEIGFSFVFGALAVIALCCVGAFSWEVLKVLWGGPV